MRQGGKKKKKRKTGRERARERENGKCPVGKGPLTLNSTVHRPKFMRSQIADPSPIPALSVRKSDQSPIYSFLPPPLLLDKPSFFPKLHPMHPMPGPFRLIEPLFDESIDTGGLDEMRAMSRKRSGLGIDIVCGRIVQREGRGML